MVSKSLYLRQHYHFGPGVIADDPKRFHQVSIRRARGGSEGAGPHWNALRPRTHARRSIILIPASI